jgi:FMN phosphatase YigB (HAD superfamily)
MAKIPSAPPLPFHYSSSQPKSSYSAPQIKSGSKTPDNGRMSSLEKKKDATNIVNFSGLGRGVWTSKLPPSAIVSQEYKSGGTFHVRDAALNEICLFVPSSSKQETENDKAIEKAARGEDAPILKQDMEERNIRMDAAVAALSRYSKGYIKDIHTDIVKKLKQANPSQSQEKITLHLVRSRRAEYTEDMTINFLSMAMQSELTDALTAQEAERQKGGGDLPKIEFEDIKTCIELHRFEHSDDPFDHFGQQGCFDTSEIRKGDHVVIVDDHAKEGGNTLSMAAALKEAGAIPISAAALTITKASFTTDPSNPQLTLSEETSKLLHKTFPSLGKGKSVVEKQLEKHGMSFETLTNQEAMMLIEQAKNLTSDTIVGKLKKSLEKRKVVDPIPIEEKHIDDWDDFLRPRKPNNFKFMHNTLAICAPTHPLIQKIAVVTEKIRNDKTHEYKEGMPKLCMKMDAFWAYAVEKDFGSAQMVRDLVDNMSGIDPELAKELDKAGKKEKEKIVNMLTSEFNRQYKQTIQPSVDESNIARHNNRQQTIKLPYEGDDAPKLELGEGIEEFLMKNRTPNKKIGVITNSEDSDIAHEINKMGIAHLFDWRAGVKEGPVVTADGIEKIGRLLSKPDQTRLKEMLRQFPGALNATLILGGDQVKDITQGRNLPEEEHGGSIIGIISNPAHQKMVDSVTSTLRITDKKGNTVDFPVYGMRSMVDVDSIG